MTIAEQSAVIAVTLAKRQFMMALITISYNDCDVLLSLISYDMQRLQRNRASYRVKIDLQIGLFGGIHYLEIRNSVSL